jgi:hypothetical protein
MIILLTGLMNIIAFYYTHKLVNNAINDVIQKQAELRNRLQMLEVEICDLNKKLRVLK